MKKLILPALLLLTGLLGAQNSRMVLYQFSSTTGQEEAAGNLLDAFRVRLINSRSFELIEGAQVENLLMAKSVTPGGRMTPDTAGEIARAIGAQYALIGHFTFAGEGSVLRLELIFAPNGKTLFVNDFPVSGGNANSSEMDIFTQKVLDQKAVVETTSLADVEVLIKAGNWEGALKMLGVYHDLKPRSDASDALEKQIRSRLGELAYQAAGRLLTNYLFEEAYIKMNEALSWDQKNLLYTQYLETIRARQAEFGQTKKNDAKAAMERLLKEERWEGAQLLLNALVQKRILDTDATEFQDRINRGRLELETYERAKKALWSRQYSQALNLINDVIVMNPARVEYQGVKQEILTNQNAAALDEQRWNRYKDSWENFDWGQTFGTNKPLALFSQEISLVLGAYNITDPNNIDSITERPFRGFDTRINWLWMLPLQPQVEFSSFYWGAAAGLTGGFSKEDTQELVTDPITLITNPVIHKDLAFDVQVYGGGSLEMSLFSFTLGWETGPFLGLWADNNSLKDVAAGTTSVSGTSFFDFGWYSTASFSWVYDNHLRLTLSLPNRWFLYRGDPGFRADSLSASGVQIGLRHTFF